MENDGSGDISLLTSLETDGLLWTSPSLNVRSNVTSSSLEENSEISSFDEPPKV